MTASLDWTVERERAVLLLAREIGDRLREHRRATGLTQTRYALSQGLPREQVAQVEAVARPNYTLFTAVRMLDVAGYELRIVPKDRDAPHPSHSMESL